MQVAGKAHNSHEEQQDDPSKLEKGVNDAEGNYPGYSGEHEEWKRDHGEQEGIGCALIVEGGSSHDVDERDRASQNVVTDWNERETKFLQSSTETSRIMKNGNPNPAS